MPWPAVAALVGRVAGPLLGRSAAGAAARVGAGAAAQNTAKQRALNKSFGSIMSGHTTMQEAADKERQEIKEAEAKQKGKAALGKLTKAALGSVAALVGIPKAVQKFGEALAARNEQLAVFSGEIAAASQRLQADRMSRQARLAARTGDSSTDQMESQSRLEEATQPWKAAGRNISNRISQALNNAVSAGVEGLNKLPVVGDLVRWLAGEEKDQGVVPFIQFLDEVGDGKWGPGERRRNDQGVNGPL